mgnify:FL=1
MPKQQTDHLIQLILSLSKGEKRSFRLFVNRNQSSEDKLFMQLFDLLDKNGEYNEEHILKRIPKLKKSQLSNVKANLYRQILLCLRNVHKNPAQEISIRENLDYAQILYQKGLYKQSLDLLEKSKKAALINRNYNLALHVLDFERHIESQHITGSMFGKAEEIRNLSQQLVQKQVIRNDLANFSLLLYGYYLQFGYVKDKNDYRFIKEFFQANKPAVKSSDLDFYEKLSLYQSYVWFHNMTQDFAHYYQYAQKWVDLFKEDPGKKYTDTSLYLKGIHNVLNALFMAQRYDKFLPAYEHLIDLGKDTKFLSDQNTLSLWTLFQHIHGINRIFLTAGYSNGIEEIKLLEQIINRNIYHWDLNRLLVFYYKIACVYFGAGDLNRAILYLNKITNHVFPNFRQDIQCFARILNLIAHFDLGNEVLVSYKVKSVYRFLLKMEDLQEVQKEIFRFLRKTPVMSREDVIPEFIKLKSKLTLLMKDPYERRPFLYLDIIAWLESKIENIPIAHVIQRNLNQ